MAMGERSAGLGLMAFSLLFMGGCSLLTPQPVSPVLQPLIAKASPAEGAIIEEPLDLGVAWLKPSDDAKTLPERATRRLLDQIREHFSEPGIPLQVSSVNTVTSVDLPTLRQLGQQHGVTHMLVVAPTVHEIVVPEKFGFPKSGFYLGTRTQSFVFLEAVALELETGSPIFEARGAGQAALEVLDYGAFGDHPRIFRGAFPPGDGSIYYPEGAKEDFPPHEVRVVASNNALARLLGELDRVKIFSSS